MSKTKEKLGKIDPNRILKDWTDLKTQHGISTKEKLEKLVGMNLKRTQRLPEPEKPTNIAKNNQAVLERSYTYPLGTEFGKIRLKDWQKVSSNFLAILSGDSNFSAVDPQKLLFFDVETTGLSGGTGTIPFMLGFGYIQGEDFLVRVFILNDLYRESEFLEKIDSFLAEQAFSATVTYNGKSFDFPLMETRYILNRQRFSLLSNPHLDFLYPARVIWKHTQDSRKLGILGENLLGISRDEDILSSQIPQIYFNYLRTQSLNLLEKVAEHNSLDIVGLACLALLGVKYLMDVSSTIESGEILGTGVLQEKFGNLDEAEERYRLVQKISNRDDLKALAIKKLSLLKKRKKIYGEAMELWKELEPFKEHLAFRELSVHYEHREKEYSKALEYVEKALNLLNLNSLQYQDMQKRLIRLKQKIQKIEQTIPSVE